MCGYLRAQFDNLKSYFNQLVTSEKVHVLLDPEKHNAIMQKYIAVDCQIVFDKHFNPIKWIYLKHLVDIQNKIGNMQEQK